VVNLSNIEKYIKMREAGMAANSKLMKYVSKDMMNHAVKLLGIRMQGNTILFDNEEETSYLMNFLLYDYKINGKNTVQVYQESHRANTEIENEVINSMRSSYSSLFEVTSIRGFTISLRDLFRETDKPKKLIDVAFSMTASSGTLLFIRLVPVGDRYMTSGVSFIFRKEIKQYLLRRYRKISKKIQAGDQDMKQYIAFFKLNKECGE
ncbi:hypothetical protein A2V71_02760, partial [Candidatus Berkelbacteria bacterium RBG_13_40_8]